MPLRSSISSPNTSENSHYPEDMLPRCNRVAGPRSLARCAGQTLDPLQPLAGLRAEHISAGQLPCGLTAPPDDAASALRMN